MSTYLKYRCNGGSRIFFQMSESEFVYLLQRVESKIYKGTNLRPVIPRNECLAVSLRFLSTGDSFTSLTNVSFQNKQFFK